jgi:putative endonuclease
MAGGYIYILGSHTGTLYIGVTSNLYQRVLEQDAGRLHCDLWLQAPTLF